MNYRKKYAQNPLVMGTIGQKVLHNCSFFSLHIKTSQIGRNLI